MGGNENGLTIGSLMKDVRIPNLPEEWNIYLKSQGGHRWNNFARVKENLEILEQEIESSSDSR